MSLHHTARSARDPRQRADARSKEIVVRNHDHTRSYVVTLDLSPPPTGMSGREVVDIPPGEVRCLSTVAPRGPTVVTGRLENGDTDTTEGRLGDEPAETALVETGNDVISVTHGL